MITYKSASNFDRSLMLEITEETRNRSVYYTYRGFHSLGHAMEFCRWWEEVTGWAYSPSSYATEENGVVTAYCQRWDSCD